MSATEQRGIRRLRPACLAIVAALCTVQPAGAEVHRYLVDTGPLRIRDQFLPSLGYLGFDPVAADVLVKGASQVDFIVTSSNSFAHSREVERQLQSVTTRESMDRNDLRSIGPDNPGDGIFYIDGEHTRWAVAARRGIGHGLQLEVVIPVIHFSGGVLDPVIEGFHDAFSLGQAGRTGVPRNAFTVYLRHGDREIYLDRAPGTVLGDVIVGLRYGLHRGDQGGSFKLAVEALAKLPAGDADRLAGSGSTDVGVQVLGANYFSHGCLHYSLGAARLGHHDLFGIDAQTVLSGMVAWETGIGGRSTAVFQATFSQSPFEDLHSAEIAAPSIQATIGLKHAFGASVFFLGLTENLNSFNNTADIGLHLGVTRVFGGD